MKKILIAISFLLLLVGCSSTSPEPDTTEIDFGNQQELKEESYDFGHGVVDYDFETWSYDGEELEFEYFIKNTGSECEFGLIFLIDGVPQIYEVEGETTEMYSLSMSTGEEQVLSIKINPRIDSDKKECNLNAFVIFNPSTKIEDIKQYGFNHSVSSTATIHLELNHSAMDPDVKVETVDVKYKEIPTDVLVQYFKGEIDVLDYNVYVEQSGVEDSQYVTKDSPIDLNVFGKSGNYRLLAVEDNHITHIYDIRLEEKQYTTVSLEIPMKETTNLYFLVVPIDIQDPYDYIMMNQSERYIVQ